MTFWRIIQLILIGAFLCVPMAGQTTRVGTFDKQAIVVAYYRSPMWAEVLNGKLAERDEAQKANDTKKVEELNAWGQAHQDLSHRQLAGEAPITNILEALEPAFSQIAERKHLARIAAEPLAADGRVETVDVTGLLLDWLKADEKTRKIIHDLQRRR